MNPIDPWIDAARGNVPAPDRVRAVSALARDRGVAAILLSTRASLRWLGIRQSDGVYALVGDGQAVLVAPSTHALQADVLAERYADQPAATALERALQRAGVGAGHAVGIEAGALPVAVAAGLRERPRSDVGASLVTARARKDAAEVALIAGAAELVAVGQAALRTAIVPGYTEVELWTAAEGALRRADGGLVEAVVDLMAGARTALVGEPPSGAVVAAGDAVLFDLAPCRDGYWADSCATRACGAPPPRLRARHDAVRAALERGLELLRPGVRAGEVDAAMRAALDTAGLSFPHHGGHGVGAAAQEEPWIVPGSETVLEPGMVVALEPGAYADGFGVRLEHLALVTASGPELLTTHSLDL